MMLAVDLQGAAVVIGAIGAFIVSVGNAFMGWRFSKKTDTNKEEAIAERNKLSEKVDAIATNVDGRATEAAKKIEALSQAVATQHAGGKIPVQEPGEPNTGAPVTIKNGQVSVDTSSVKGDNPEGKP